MGDDCFEIRITVEIGRHGWRFDAGIGWEDGADSLQECPRGDAAVIRRAEQPSVRLQAGGGELCQGAVVGFGAKHLALLVSREARRVEDDAVKLSTLFREAAEPVEGIAFYEVVALRIDLVETHILSRPVEVGL